jgi:DoxX-like protein
MSKSRFRAAAYWITTILGPSSFVIGGVLLLTHDPTALSGLTHLGYPVYFATFLGLSKLLGAIVITLPSPSRIKEWAYAGFAFDLTAAAFSHLSAGDGTAEVAAPLVFLALVLASYALRPSASGQAHAPTKERLASRARATLRMSFRNA